MADPKKISELTAKSPPVDNDAVPIFDSAQALPANQNKKVLWSVIKSTLKTYFDGLYTLANLGGLGLHAKADTAGNADTVTNGVYLQSSTPGTAQTGNLNVTGTAIFGSDITMAGTLSGVSTILPPPGANDLTLRLQSTDAMIRLKTYDPSLGYYVDRLALGTGGGSTPYIIFPSAMNVGIGTTNPIFKADVDGALYSRKRQGQLNFDNAVAGTLVSALAETAVNGLYTPGGANHVAANVTVQKDGVQITTSALDNDSATILVNLPALNTTQKPKYSFRFKLDSITNAYCAVGVTTAAFADKATLPNNCALLGIDADNAHGFGAARLIFTTKDDAAAAVIDNTGVNMVAGTWVWGVVDLTDTEQPRVWIAGTEIAAGSILGTVKDATNFYLYFHVQNLAAGAHTLTAVCDKWVQDQP